MTSRVVLEQRKRRRLREKAKSRIGKMYGSWLVIGCKPQTYEVRVRCTCGCREVCTISLNSIYTKKYPMCAAVYEGSLAARAAIRRGEAP